MHVEIRLNEKKNFVGTSYTEIDNKIIFWMKI